MLSEHWAERDGVGGGRAPRVALVNRVLGCFGLRLYDWGGPVYVLRDRKGASADVSDLGSLWVEAARLAGRPLDPLDPVLLRTLG
jgi:hypothetical protein